jgi:DNA-binding CsgD family transcriptional regulator
MEKWRLEHPHDTPPYRFTPSPTFGHSSMGLDEDNAVLTFRERQCLGWASLGKTMQEMATILRVTPRVVKFHLDNGRRKLGASTLPHAVALAIRRELLP